MLSYFTLYSAHGLKVFSFIILIPHFISLFPKNVWGQILIVQALALWLQILVEYGFNFSATRSMSRARESDDKIGDLVSGVIGAKFILSFVAAVFAFVVYFSFYKRSLPPALMAWGVVFAVAQGFSPIWYFTAREKFGQYASIDLVSRFFYLFLCLFFIRFPNQGWMIFALGILTSVLANTTGYMLMFRQVPMKSLNLRNSIQSLKDGFGMFLFVGTTSVYTTLNLVILGLSQNVSIVAEYGTADRIVRSASGLLDPLNRVVYSRISFLYVKNTEDAILFLKKASLVIIVFSLIVFSVGQMFSSKISYIMAPNYPETAIYIKYLLFYIQIIALNNILGIHYKH